VKLNEEVKRNRELMGLTPLNEQWSGNQVFHEFQDCAGSAPTAFCWFGACIPILDEVHFLNGWPQMNATGTQGGYSIGGASPYTSSMTTNVGGGTNVWDTYENSEAVWDFLGAMAPGQVLRNMVVTGNTAQQCIQYIGPVTSGQFQQALGSGVGGGMLSGTTGPYASCGDCLTAVITPTPSWDCNGGVCSDPGTGNGQYSSSSACNTACGVTPSWDCNGGVCSDPGTGNGQYSSSSACNTACVPVIRYRCHDCTTPCSQNVIQAGFCPYTTVSSCMQACADTNKWRCGLPTKFGGTRCRPCKQFELTNGTDCYNTKQDCLDNGDCFPRRAGDKEIATYASIKKSAPNVDGGEIEIDDVELLRENIKKQLRLITESTKVSVGQARGKGVLDLTTRRLRDFKPGEEEKLLAMGTGGSQPAIEPENPTPKDIDVDKPLNEQTQTGNFIAACDCGVLGIVYGTPPSLWCPASQQGPGQWGANFYYAQNATMNGGVPTGGTFIGPFDPSNTPGDIIWLDDYGPGATFNRSIEVADGGVLPANTNYSVTDLGSCTCPGNSSCAPSSSCTQPDFDYAASCGSAHLGPAPGNAPSFQNWLDARWNGYQSGGCNHFQSVINWITPQLATATGNSLLRKQAKIDWAGCMVATGGPCNC